MSCNYYAGQYEDRYKPSMLGNWCTVEKNTWPGRCCIFSNNVMKMCCHNIPIGITRFIADENGHLLPGVPRSTTKSPWGKFVTNAFDDVPYGCYGYDFTKEKPSQSSSYLLLKNMEHLIGPPPQSAPLTQQSSRTGKDASDVQQNSSRKPNSKTRSTTGKNGMEKKKSERSAMGWSSMFMSTSDHETRKKKSKKREIRIKPKFKSKSASDHDIGKKKSAKRPVSSKPEFKPKYASDHDMEKRKPMKRPESGKKMDMKNTQRPESSTKSNLKPQSTRSETSEMHKTRLPESAKKLPVKKLILKKIMKLVNAPKSSSEASSKESIKPKKPPSKKPNSKLKQMPIWKEKETTSEEFIDVSGGKQKPKNPNQKTTEVKKTMKKPIPQKQISSVRSQRDTIVSSEHGSSTSSVMSYAEEQVNKIMKDFRKRKPPVLLLYGQPMAGADRARDHYMKIYAKTYNAVPLKLDKKIESWSRLSLPETKTSEIEKNRDNEAWNRENRKLSLLKPAILLSKKLTSKPKYKLTTQETLELLKFAMIDSPKLSGGFVIDGFPHDLDEALYYEPYFWDFMGGIQFVSESLSPQNKTEKSASLKPNCIPPKYFRRDFDYNYEDVDHIVDYFGSKSIKIYAGDSWSPEDDDYMNNMMDIFLRTYNQKIKDVPFSVSRSKETELGRKSEGVIVHKDDVLALKQHLKESNSNQKNKDGKKIKNTAPKNPQQTNEQISGAKKTTKGIKNTFGTQGQYSSSDENFKKTSIMKKSSLLKENTLDKSHKEKYIPGYNGAGIKTPRLNELPTKKLVMNEMPTKKLAMNEPQKKSRSNDNRTLSGLKPTSKIASNSSFDKTKKSPQPKTSKPEKNYSTFLTFPTNKKKLNERRPKGSASSRNTSPGSANRQKQQKKSLKVPNKSLKAKLKTKQSKSTKNQSIQLLYGPRSDVNSILQSVGSHRTFPQTLGEKTPGKNKSKSSTVKNKSSKKVEKAVNKPLKVGLEQKNGKKIILSTKAIPIKAVSPAKSSGPKSPVVPTALQKSSTDGTKNINNSMQKVSSKKITEPVLQKVLQKVISKQASPKTAAKKKTLMASPQNIIGRIINAPESISSFEKLKDKAKDNKPKIKKETPKLRAKGITKKIKSMTVDISSSSSSSDTIPPDNKKQNKGAKKLSKKIQRVVETIIPSSSSSSGSGSGSTTSDTSSASEAPKKAPPAK